MTIGIFYAFATCVIFMIIAGVVFYLHGYGEGRRDGIREYHNADKSEQFNLLMETRL